MPQNMSDTELYRQFSVFVHVSDWLLKYVISVMSIAEIEELVKSVLTKNT